MKPIKNSRKLLALAACVFPLLSNAMAIDSSQSSQENFKPTNTSSCCQSTLGVLSPVTNNANLTYGSYLFGNLQTSKEHSSYNTWTFSLAQNSQIELGFVNFDADLNMKNTKSKAGRGIQLELFDNKKNSLGAVGKDSSLNLLLAANINYSLVVSSADKRKLHSPYVGKLLVNPPAAVPLGDALPMFTASLLMLGFKLRARFQKR